MSRNTKEEQVDDLHLSIIDINYRTNKSIDYKISSHINMFLRKL